MKFFIRWLITAIAVAFAVWVLPDSMIVIVGTSAWIAVAIASVILAFLNVFIKPFLQFLSCGFMLVTLGLFSLVINAGLLYFTSWICHDLLGIGFFINGFWGAFWAGLIVSVVTFFLSMFVGPNETSMQQQQQSPYM